MKKILAVTALTLIVVLAFAAPAFAVKPVNETQAQKIDWYTVGSFSSDYVTGVQVPGHVNLNTPDGAVTMVINGVITLDPNTQYVVWIREFSGYTGDFINSYTPLGYYALGSFTTDMYGEGAFHFNIASSDLTASTRNIQVAVNTSPVSGNGVTVAATPKYAVVTNN
jgi:hypothetical protein